MKRNVLFSFYNVEGVEEDQANLERRLIQYFQTEVRRDRERQ